MTKKPRRYALTSVGDHLALIEPQMGELTPITAIGHHKLSQIWYNAAIFCLQSADFMKIPNIRSVQAIAVLGMCFNIWGDSDLGQHMWSCALRIAQRLGLDSTYSEIAGVCLNEETQHRLWWTLVICEW